MDRSYKELIFDIYENYEYLPIATLEVYPDEEEEGDPS
jgi:hypothetical protein